MSDKKYIGIDIGGTSAKIGIVDKKGNIIQKVQIPTSSSNKWQHVIDDFIKPIENWQAEGHNIAGIGLGAPGAIDKHTRMLTDCVNIPILINAPFIEYIENKFNIPVIGDNDATCAAVGEHIFGAGKKFKNFIMVTVGTGIGGGIILNDTVYRGRDGFAGELGHMIAVPEGRKCSCGNRGCIETYSSATAMIKYIKDGIKKQFVTSYNDLESQNLDAKMILDKAKNGDVYSVEAVDTAVSYLGRLLGSIVNLLNLEAVIIGGGVAAAGEYYMNKVNFYVNQIAWKSFSYNLEVLPAKLLNDAGIIGAASLILEEEK